ncbi:MAG: hypothetical protein FK732_01270 [Asgard group archaeon]|nr:hypothetical protein [Asgard group archaeon]
MTDKMFCAMFIGKTKSEIQAAQMTNKYKNCPYVYFIASKHLTVYGIYILPESKKWWLEYIEKFPGKETLGLETIEVHYIDDVKYPNPQRMKIPKKLL